ncbi:hypothetical protein SAMN02910292_02555 [Lachnospiraceae bacterium XBB2008]|nr:hypothetical protein SAMN02910292_02555 [Lachnospiraceae bacterium XBB2008]
MLTGWKICFRGRRFTLDGHLIGSIGEVASALYYDITLVRTNKKTIDGFYLNKTVQIKTAQQESVSIYFDNDGIEPDYLLVLYLNKSGSLYEVYNGPWGIVRKNGNPAGAHGYTQIRINALLELGATVDLDDRIPQNKRILTLTQENKNPLKKTNKNDKEIAAFSQRYYKIIENPNTDEEELNRLFPDDCRSIGFEMDSGNSFIALYGKDAFHNIDSLKETIQKVDEVMVLGSGIFSKWRYLTHWAEESVLSETNIEWFLLALNRLYELTKRESLRVRIVANGIKKEKRMTVSYEAGAFLFNGSENHLLEDEILQLVAERYPIGGTYYPEESDPRNVINVLQNHFFDTVIDTQNMEITGIIKPIPQSGGPGAVY